MEVMKGLSIFFDNTISLFNNFKIPNLSIMAEWSCRGNSDTRGRESQHDSDEFVKCGNFDRPFK